MTDKYQYWPFEISDVEKEKSEQAEKIKFLEDAYLDGFRACRAVEGLDDYGASSDSRSGYILQRGRKNRWEFLLSEGNNLHFSALVTSFSIAAAAVRAWLNKSSTSEILGDINEYLIAPPRLEEFWKVK